MKPKTGTFLLSALLAQASFGSDLIDLDEWNDSHLPKYSSDLPYEVVDTGQGNCYDDLIEIFCPGQGQAFFGQDAQYLGNQMRYRDNHDGTVSDASTGLMWRQSSDLDGDGDIDVADKLSYDAALIAAQAMDIGGYDDWRLPTIKELYSLIDFSGIDPTSLDSVGGAQPFIDDEVFDFGYGDVSAGERIIDAQFASTTLYASTTMGGAATMFGVNFADGRIKGYPRDGKLFYVLFVRGNQEYGLNDFRDNLDGTISDRASGLMWDLHDSVVGLDWQEALAWVEQKNGEAYLGYSDWRLPDAKELQSIVDYGRCPDTTQSPALDPVFDATSIVNEGGDIDFGWYWSSTSHLRDDDREAAAAVYVAFGRATGYMQGRWLDVHGAGAQRSDPKVGDPEDFPFGRGPQGDGVRVDNLVRLVRSDTRPENS